MVHLVRKVSKAGLVFNVIKYKYYVKYTIKQQK